MKFKGLSLLIALFFVLGAWGYAPQVSTDNYWQLRTGILLGEDSRRIGGDLKLESEKEQIANQTLMAAKLKELDEGFRAPITFLPAQNFMLVKDKISQSPVFKIIQKMPKGALLHTHDYLMTSFDYFFKNITHRPDLYACDVNGVLHFKYFKKPTSDCQWQLLSDIRKNDKNGTIDERILHQLKVLQAKDPVQENSGDGYLSLSQLHTFLVSVFSLLSYRPVLEDYIYQGLLELYEDNVFYMELHTPLLPVCDLDGKEYGTLETAHIYMDVANKFIKDHPDFIGMKLIYTVNRTVSDSEMDQFLSKARMLVENLPGFVVGFDLMYPEARSRPLVQFADKLRAVSKDVPFFLHAGESNWNGEMSDENLIDALLLGTKRIGNGFDMMKHPELLELARQKNIAIEILPISNQAYSLVKDLRNHPASLLFANNYPVVVANGSPSMWGAQGLSYDFYEAFMGLMSRHADLRALKKLALNSIAYSSMNELEKKRAADIWQGKWNQFVSELAGGNYY